MKKAVFAGALLMLMIGVSCWNIHFLDSFTDDLTQIITLSRDHFQAGDIMEATQTLDQAMTLWTGTKGYTHVFLRHAEIDAVTDAFYDLKSVLYAENKAEADGVYGRLLSHIQSIDEMEHVSLGSVF